MKRKTLTSSWYRKHITCMKISLDHIVHTVYGLPLKKQSNNFLATQSKYASLYGPQWFTRLPEEVQKSLESESDQDMSLGYLLVEAMPKAIVEKAPQNEVLQVGKLQRRLAKGGEQDFTVDEVAMMKKAACEFLAERQMLAVADIVCEMLEGSAS